MSSLSAHVLAIADALCSWLFGKRISLSHVCSGDCSGCSFTQWVSFLPCAARRDSRNSFASYLEFFPCSPILSIFCHANSRDLGFPVLENLFPQVSTLAKLCLSCLSLNHGLKTLPAVNWGTCSTYHVYPLLVGVSLLSHMPIVQCLKTIVCYIVLV